MLDKQSDSYSDQIKSWTKSVLDNAAKDSMNELNENRGLYKIIIINIKTTIKIISKVYHYKDYQKTVTTVQTEELQL